MKILLLSYSPHIRSEKLLISSFPDLEVVVLSDKLRAEVGKDLSRKFEKIGNLGDDSLKKVWRKLLSERDENKDLVILIGNRGKEEFFTSFFETAEEVELTKLIVLSLSLSIDELEKRARKFSEHNYSREKIPEDDFVEIQLKKESQRILLLEKIEKRMTIIHVNCDHVENLDEEVVRQLKTVK